MSCLDAKDLLRIFQELDKNGKGIISVDQLQCLLHKIGPHQASLDELQELIGGNPFLDSIDFYFFYEIMIKNHSMQSVVKQGFNLINSDLLKAFQVFDLNGDGFITCEELESVLSRLGLWDEKEHGKDCQMMIDMYDKNSDGRLDFEEFKLMMLLSTCN